MIQSPGPTFSIVTPSFRMFEWLRLCAASVADQMGATFEHIVQDGGTGPELDEWARQRPGRFRCFQEKDAGMYDAINRGIRRAQGRFLAYLNCDEQYLPGTLEKVEKFFAAHPEIDVLFGDALLVDEMGRALSYRRVVRPSRVHTRLDHLGTLSCATFFRRTIADRGLLFDTRWRSIGDCVWIYTMLGQGISMACLHEPLAVYAFTGVNLSASECGLREMRDWSREADAPSRLLRPAAVLWHRLRKMAAGAYRTRNLEYAIYTKSSPKHRVRFEASRIHFGWPGATAPRPNRYSHHLAAREGGTVKISV
jgi:glycosyltransferase involved in cell wall biosynthesis